MEVGSNNSNDSFHGLMFGQKIYFEDVCTTGSSSTASMAVVPTPATKKGKNHGVAHPPRCQVEGCMVDLSHSKPYYSRHKVCGMHSKSPKVVVAGLDQRFCQQCSRFHQLLEFDHGKRSCRRKLAGHNKRRRKPSAAPLLSRTGDISRPSCSILDMSYPKFLGSSINGVWPSIGFGSSGHSRPITPHQWPCGVGSAHVSMSPGSSGRVLFSSSGDVLQAQESTCALSLLSSQTWAPATTQPASCFDRHQTSQTMTSNGYMNGDTSNESGGGRSHLLRNVMEFNRPQFSGELEKMALEGCTRNMELDHGRCYCNSHDGIHWSL